ncbi:hypothetical protein HY389_00235 [Candidatus Daviesbacteria bacterium]|nr:hypothetical protein [Candidatus Daviesbacteria bacterium]
MCPEEISRRKVVIESVGLLAMVLSPIPFVGGYAALRRKEANELRLKALVEQEQDIESRVLAGPHKLVSLRDLSQRPFINSLFWENDYLALSMERTERGNGITVYFSWQQCLPENSLPIVSKSPIEKAHFLESSDSNLAPFVEFVFDREKLIRNSPQEPRIWDLFAEEKIAVFRSGDPNSYLRCTSSFIFTMPYGFRLPKGAV